MEILREGLAAGKMSLSPKERQWLERIEGELAAMPGEEEGLVLAGEYSFDPASYGM